MNDLAGYAQTGWKKRMPGGHFSRDDAGAPRWEVSGFSHQYISDLERGRRNPPVISLFDLAQGLEATLAELVTQK